MTFFWFKYFCPFFLVVLCIAAADFIFVFDFFFVCLFCKSDLSSSSGAWGTAEQTFGHSHNHVHWFARTTAHPFPIQCLLTDSLNIIHSLALSLSFPHSLTNVHVNTHTHRHTQTHTHTHTHTHTLTHTCPSACSSSYEGASTSIFSRGISSYSNRHSSGTAWLGHVEFPSAANSLSWRLSPHLRLSGWQTKWPGRASLSMVINVGTSEPASSLEDEKWTRKRRLLSSVVGSLSISSVCWKVFRGARRSRGTI